MIYQSSTKFNHNTKQWDILMIKSKEIYNYTSKYNNFS
jgi:hypothetical protein